MKKVLLSMAIAALVYLPARAQKKEGLKFSIGVDAGIPVGDISSYSSFAYGGSLQAELPILDKFSVTANAGYLKFSGKSGVTISGALIPVLVGARYYFSDKVYGSGQLGVSLSTESGGGSAFTFAPGIGVKLTESFDILAKYQSASKDGSNVSFLGVRVAYIF